MLTNLLQVAAGGAIGASARYLTNVSATRFLGHGFPWGTIIANIAGSFLMGVIVVVLARKGGNAYAPLIMTGMLGGFTTFSAFSLDTFTLVERGDIWQAALYVLGTLAIGLAAIVAGVLVTRALMA